LLERAAAPPPGPERDESKDGGGDAEKARGAELRSPDATVVGPLTFFAPSACQYRMVPSNATVIWVPSGAITPPKLAVPDASLKRPVPPVNV
jgi:hypothetical protein